MLITFWTVKPGWWLEIYGLTFALGTNITERRRVEATGLAQPVEETRPGPSRAGPPFLPLTMLSISGTVSTCNVSISMTATGYIWCYTT